MSPTSIAVPVNTIAVFKCVVNCTNICQAIWHIGGISTAHQRTYFFEQGFDFPQRQSSHGIFTTTLSANASTTVNNTQLLCVVDNNGDDQYADSTPAWLKVLSGK